MKNKALRAPVVTGLVMMLPAAACGQTAAMTLQDFTARSERRIMAADIDGDGKMSKAEFLGATKSGKGDPARRFARLDRNADGLIDKQEIAAIAARRFARLDGDGNGSLTREERASAKTMKSGASEDGA